MAITTPSTDVQSVVPTVDCGREKATDACVPAPMGLQALALTAEEAEAIRQILDDPTHPTHEGKEMPTADASVFRRKS